MPGLKDLPLITNYGLRITNYGELVGSKNFIVDHQFDCAIKAIQKLGSSSQQRTQVLLVPAQGGKQRQ